MHDLVGSREIEGLDRDRKNSEDLTGRPIGVSHGLGAGMIIESQQDVTVAATAFFSTSDKPFFAPFNS